MSLTGYAEPMTAPALPIVLQVIAGGALVGAKPWTPPPGAGRRQQYACEIPGISGHTLTADPVPVIAKILMHDGYPPGVNFGLRNRKGEWLFIGLIGEEEKKIAGVERG